MKYERYQISEGESQEKIPDKSHLERAMINGIKMKVGWDRGWNNYVIFFPQIELNEQTLNKGVTDQLIEISKNPARAKEVFDYAAKLAETEPDVYKLYQQVKEFVGKITN